MLLPVCTGVVTVWMGAQISYYSLFRTYLSLYSVTQAGMVLNNFGMDGDLLYVSEIQVSDGLKIKRYIPRAKGSASPIIKRNANLTVVVAERK